MIIQLHKKNGITEVDVSKKTVAQLQALGLGEHHLVKEKDFKERFAAASTTDEKINIISEKLNLT